MSAFKADAASARVNSMSPVPLGTAPKIFDTRRSRIIVLVSPVGPPLLFWGTDGGWANVRPASQRFQTCMPPRRAHRGACGRHRACGRASALVGMVRRHARGSTDDVFAPLPPRGCNRHRMRKTLKE